MIIQELIHKAPPTVRPQIVDFHEHVSEYFTDTYLDHLGEKALLALFWLYSHGNNPKNVTSAIMRSFLTDEIDAQKQHIALEGLLRELKKQNSH
ncbi:MAG: hypothetical protein ACRBBW_16225 [Cellvibrionaceae bacterium]